MSEGAEAGRPPPPDLVEGEVPLWKMADVRGLFVRHLITGYLVTSYRCFIWDVEKNAVTVSVPINLADVTVEGKRQGKRQRRGGSFIVPRTADFVPPAMGEPVEIGDLFFRMEGRPVMVLRAVAEPVRVKSLIDALRSQVRVPPGLGVDSFWSTPDETHGRRS
ncbi:MAG: hypothetical protein OK474_03830 [Thaumarchaeota archaeon]|nr:hypothetical protein [Nitrososphaerota archaeon]